MTSAGRSSRSPNTLIRILCRWTRSSSPTFRKFSAKRCIRCWISSLGRRRFSVENAYTVRMRTPTSRHHSRTSSSLSRPFTWPSRTLPRPISRANRRFPSMMIAQVWVVAAGRTWWSSRRSYAWYAASLMIFEMSVGIDGFSRVGPTYLSIRGHVHREAPPVRSDAPAVVQSVRRTHPQTFKYRPQIGATSSFIRQRGLVALSMKLSEYQDLYRRLSTAEDIDFLAENFGLDKELLLVIYTQRIVRETTKKFYRVKAQARRLAFMWQNGESLLGIARKFEFPPILTALMVLEQRKISRKQFWKMINELDSVKDRRLRQELAEVNHADIVYSPEGSARQYARGRWGEAKLQTWLNARSLQYETEKERRSDYDKTPASLLHHAAT